MDENISSASIRRNMVTAIVISSVDGSKPSCVNRANILRPLFVKRGASSSIATRPVNNNLSSVPRTKIQTFSSRSVVTKQHLSPRPRQPIDETVWHRIGTQSMPSPRIACRLCRECSCKVLFLGYFHPTDLLWEQEVRRSNRRAPNGLRQIVAQNQAVLAQNGTDPATVVSQKSR